MKIVYDPAFVQKLKKVDVRIRKQVKARILLFWLNPHDPQLRNHSLKRKYAGYHSIDITEDWRAIYKEIIQGEELIAYFVIFGTHEELYK